MRRLQGFSTLCALFGSALIVAEMFVGSNGHAGGRPGSSAELVAALLLMVSCALELFTYRRQQRTVSQFGIQFAWRPPFQLVVLLLGITFLMGVAFLIGGETAARYWGIVPRTLGGLPGIALGCFVHLSWRHCFWNILGVVLLGCLAFRAAFTVAGSEGQPLKGQLPATFAAASAFIVLTSGVCVWCLARPAVHAGASGVVCGYLGLLLALSLRRRDVPLTSLLMVLAVVASYGGAAILTGRTAGGPRLVSLYAACASRTVSSEHHTFGFLSGLASALFFCQQKLGTGDPRSLTESAPETPQPARA